MIKDNNAPLLTRTECSAMRALAIIGIALHNYCHWLGFAVKENEYTFTIDNAHGLVRAITSPDMNLPVHLLSFFGHYGVPVFLFLSAYGLVMKYEKGLSAKDTWTDRFSFVRSHYIKLFNMMIVGFVAFTMLDAITPGAHRYAVTDILGQLFMFNNMLPEPDRVVWPGPYWFFGLMLQLYVVYRFVLMRRGWKTVAVLIAACWAMQMICAPEGDALNRIRYNCMGGILPFGAGLLFARHGHRLSRSTWMAVALVSMIAVVFFSMNFQLWLWAPLMVCAAATGIAKATPESLNRYLSWVGGISAALFVIHPLTRKIFIPISRRGDVYTGLLLYVIASVALALVAKQIIDRLNSHKK